MNYYSYYIPYNYPYPIKRGFSIKNMFNNIKVDSILNKTQKTLSIVNQAIPLIRQAKPVINNAKTMFTVMKEIKNINSESEINKSNYKTVNKTVNETIISNSNSPTFFQ